jgi:hypothetical protein
MGGAGGKIINEMGEREERERERERRIIYGERERETINGSREVGTSTQHVNPVRLELKSTTGIEKNLPVK